MFMLLDNGMNMEKVIETRPIKTRLHNQLSLPRC